MVHFWVLFTCGCRLDTFTYKLLLFYIHNRRRLCNTSFACCQNESHIRIPPIPPIPPTMKPIPPPPTPPIGLIIFFLCLRVRAISCVSVRVHMSAQARALVLIYICCALRIQADDLHAFNKLYDCSWQKCRTHLLLLHSLRHAKCGCSELRLLGRNFLFALLKLGGLLVQHAHHLTRECGPTR